MRTLIVNHEEAVETMAVERYVLGDLQGSEWEQCEEHFFSCLECARKVRELAALAPPKELTGHSRETEPPEAWPAPAPGRRWPLLRRKRESTGFFTLDWEYMRRLTDGDGDAERRFVAYFSPLLLIKLKQRVRSREELEDLRQEIFLRVLQSLRHGPGVRRPESLGAFVNSVCNNVFLEHLRGRSMFEPREEPETATAPRDQDANRSYLGALFDRAKKWLRRIFGLN